MKSKTRTHVFLSLITILAILISVTSATYAWFTSHTAVNVETMDGTVGHSEGSLLISATPDGEFSTTCKLIASTPENGLSPLSTADLNTFFRARTQDQNEVIIDFTDAGDRADADSIHGHLYLKSTVTDSDVYLLRHQLDFGTQVQTIAALRLGLKITVAGESYTYIFRLDDMLDVSGAAAKATIPTQYAGMVVGGSVNAPAMTADPASAIGDYSATGSGEAYTLGAKLFTLPAEQVADVEFRLYLEGCDENCFNEVQNLEAAMQLAFYGESAS